MNTITTLAPLLVANTRREAPCPTGDTGNPDRFTGTQKRKTKLKCCWNKNQHWLCAYSLSISLLTEAETADANLNQWVGHVVAKVCKDTVNFVDGYCTNAMDGPL